MALVVARYNEDISWITEFSKKYIYNKGDSSTIPAGLLDSVISLPNVGREAHTYLHHIIQNYDNLDDITIFSQGRYSDHIGFSPQVFKEQFSNISGYSRNYIDSSCWGINKRDYKFNIQNWNNSCIGHGDLEYGPWFERVFKQPYNNSTLVYCAAIFSVDKQHILSRPKIFYESLIKELDYHSAPIEAHFMERSWLEVFT